MMLVYADKLDVTYQFLLRWFIDVAFDGFTAF